MRVRVRVCVCVCVFVYVDIYTHTYVCGCVFVCVNIYRYTYVHTHTYTQGSLNCNGMVLQEDAGKSISGRLYCFYLEAAYGTSRRRILCACDTEGERTNWIRQLTMVRDSVAHIHRQSVEYSHTDGR